MSSASSPASRSFLLSSGVVVYNHMKLQMIKNKVAATGGGKGDEEKPKDSER